MERATGGREKSEVSVSAKAHESRDLKESEKEARGRGNEDSHIEKAKASMAMNL